jgi:hypothetical protein
MAHIPVPTHLQTRDKFLLGLTFGQVLLCACAVGGAWLGILALPVALPLRLAFASMVLLVGGALALVQPGGRSVDDWCFILAGYLVSARRLRYRKGGH